MAINHVINSNPNDQSPLTFPPGSVSMDEVLQVELLNAFDELQTEGEPDLIVELIDLYLGDAPLRIEEMARAVANSDWSALKRAAHNLKGSSGNLGVRQVAETCMLMEAVETNQAGERSEQLVSQLHREFARARAALMTERLRRTT